jgi:hypothetical protein
MARRDVVRCNFITRSSASRSGEHSVQATPTIPALIKAPSDDSPPSRAQYPLHPAQRRAATVSVTVATRLRHCGRSREPIQTFLSTSNVKQSRRLSSASAAFLNHSRIIDRKSLAPSVTLVVSGGALEFSVSYIVDNTKRTALKDQLFTNIRRSGGQE